MSSLPSFADSVRKRQIDVYSTYVILPIERFQLTLLDNLAQSVRDLQRGESECLQLELDIRRQYLESGNAYSKAVKRLVIHPRVYARTNARIKELNEAIVRLNPLFKPVQPVRKTKTFHSLFRLCLFMALLIGMFLLLEWTQKPGLSLILVLSVYLPVFFMIDPIPLEYRDWLRPL